MKEFLKRNLGIEDVFLLSFCFISLLAIYLSKPDFLSNSALFLKQTFFTFKKQIWHFTGFFPVCFLLWIISLFHLLIFYRFVEKQNFSLNFSFAFLKNSLYFLKTFFLVGLTFSFVLLLLGIWTDSLKERVLNKEFLRLEKKVFGTSLTLWFNFPSNPLKKIFNFFETLFVESFLFLGDLITVSFFVFYFSKNEKLFKGFLISFFLVLLLALPFWYFFPVHSFFNGVLFGPERNLLLAELNSYSPTQKLSSLQKDLHDQQSPNFPISTFPSMHWAWALLLVYWWKKLNKKSLIFFLPWFILATTGTIYVGAHYLFDGLLAIPLALFSIFSSEFLVKKENKFFLPNEKERKFKEGLRNFLIWPLEKEWETIKRLV
jgi:hypothetical protein